MANVYKICGADEWREACQDGAYAGSAADRADGFVHLSAADQVAGTAHRHFAGQPDLVIVEYDEADLPPLNWEPSRGGALFPHLYGPLPTRPALRVAPLPWTGARHELPWGLPQ